MEQAHLDVRRASGTDATAFRRLAAATGLMTDEEAEGFAAQVASGQDGQALWACACVDGAVVGAAYGARESFSDDVWNLLFLASLDQDTRTELWNFSRTLVEASLQQSTRSASSALLVRIWRDLWRQPADDMPVMAHHTIVQLKSTFLDAGWDYTYDAVEFICQFFNNETVAAAYNDILVRNLCGFRFIGMQLAPVVSETEVGAVERPLEDPEVSDVVGHHLSRALGLLADRADPDYANSVKESISAVEAQLRSITGKSPMGSALDALKDGHPELHPALVKSWKSLYGYASDEDGVRHGSEDVPSVDQATAVYVLVTCSALVSLLNAAFDASPQ